MVQPSSPPGARSTPRATPKDGARTMRHALACLCDAVLGPPPWRAPADIALAWTQTQWMWTAPGACSRGTQMEGGGFTPPPGDR